MSMKARSSSLPVAARGPQAASGAPTSPTTRGLAGRNQQAGLDTAAWPGHALAPTTGEPATATTAMTRGSLRQGDSPSAKPDTIRPTRQTTSGGSNSGNSGSSNSSNSSNSGSSNSSNSGSSNSSNGGGEGMNGPSGGAVAFRPSGSSADARAGTTSSGSGRPDGSSSSRGGVVPPAAAAPSLEGARRAAVMWQWKQLMEPRQGPQGPLAPGPNPSRVPPVAASGVAPAPAPPAPAAATNSGSANVASAATAAGAPPTSSLQFPKPVSAGPHRVLQVPGLRAPPLSPPAVPNAATGEPAAGHVAAAAVMAAAAPPAARVPKELLPLTLQGRISLMEAAMTAAAAVTEAAAARRPLKVSGGGGGATAQERAERPAIAARKAAAGVALAGAAATTAQGICITGGTAASPAGGDKAAMPGSAAVADAGQGTGPALAATAAQAPTAAMTAVSTAVATTSRREPVGVGAAASGSRKPSHGSDDSKTTTEITAAPADTPQGPIPPRNDARTQGASTAAATSLVPELSAARKLLARLARYIPTGREDGPALLAPYQRYQYGPYQEAAAAAAAHPELLLRPQGLQQLSCITAAYAAAGHRHEPFLRALSAMAAEKMAAPRAQRGAGRSASSKTARGAAAAPATPSAAAPLTFRTACVMLTALARLRYRDAGLTAQLGRWLAAALRSGTVSPRAKWKGTWLAAALWAYATLERMAAREDAVAVRGPAAAPAADASAAGAVLFSEAAEAIRVDPGWLYLMDCREALWALWALKVAAAMYGPTAGERAAAAAVVPAAAAARVPYTPQPLVELQLLERAASQLDQLDPGQLAEAHAVAAEAGFGADGDMLAALRRCTLARVAAVRPQPLSVMVASLAVMQVRDVAWLSALAAACRNQMINMKAEQIVVVLHSFAAALRFYYLPLFHAAAVMCTLPGFARLGAMPAGDVVRLAAAYSAVGHYEAILLRRTAERILTLGSAATAWQRANVLQSCSRLAYRHNPLLRAVAAEAFAHAAPSATSPLAAAAAAVPAASGPANALAALPPAQLAAVAAACGQLQFRPPGLLRALHATRVVEWPRLGLAQRASLCWALLVLSGGLAGDVPATAAAGAEPSAECSVADGGAAAAAAARRHRRSAEPSSQLGAQQRDQRQQPPVLSLPAQLQRRQQQLLLTALCEYLGALAATDWRSWPTSDHHAQLLVACSVLTWGSLQQQQQQQTLQQQQPNQPEQQQQKREVGGNSGPQPSSPAAATAAVEAAPTGGAAGGCEGSRFTWAASSPALRAAVERLPAGAMRKALAAHHRLRQAVLGPWAAAIADVVRQVVEGAAAADAAAAAASGVRPWLELGGPPRRAAAASGVSWRVRGGTVSHGLLLCGGALGIDVCVEMELEEAEEAEEVAVAASSQAGEAAGDATEEARLAGETPCSGGTTPGAIGAAVERGEDGRTEQRGVRQPRRRQRVLIALELCAPPPPGAGSAAGAAATSGGGVVRNSRWLLSGSAALRRRLLTGLGWRVVAVRERTWQGLRSPEQQRRAVEAWLRRAVLQAAANEAAAAERSGAAQEAAEVRGPLT
ncbi:hypothetical protein PLESTF_001779600 [Pleodorina starrii]|nr:hypothetical protein PLESTF_001779600 [Pleodorina starrii]